MSLGSDDGLTFDTESLTTQAIKAEQEFGSVRLKTTAHLGKTRIPITVDIGFGDAMTERDYTIEYPSLLDMPMANVRAYPPATVVAEKFQAIVALGLANSRMKDYYDLWAINNAQVIEARALEAAIRATFERRSTAVPKEVPVGLSDEFVGDAQKMQQWDAYTASIDIDSLSLDRIVETIWSYIGPTCEHLTDR